MREFFYSSKTNKFKVARESIGWAKVMKIQEIGSRGVVFTFDDLSSENYECPTNIYLIKGEKYLYICDTFLGPQSMIGVKDYIRKLKLSKPIVLFNSHYDWDHHWGNCAFDSAMIIGNRLCYDLILKHGEEDKEEQKNYLRGEIVITPPNLLFCEELKFIEDEIIFFHSPGHTKDSSSCYDSKDKILYAADNIEEPIPYIRSNLDGIKKYVKSLNRYLEMDFTILIPGHGKISDRKFLQLNLDYLSAFPDLIEPVNVEKNSKQYYMIHLQNLSTLAMKTAEDGKRKEAIKYYQKLIELGTQFNLIGEGTVKTFKEKIEILKKKD